MATIQRITLKSGKASYRVFIRLGNEKPITKTFKNKKAALEYSRRIEGDNELALAMGDPVTNGLLLSTLIDEYIGQFSGKDKNVFYRLAWWYEHYGHMSLADISHTTIRAGLKQLSNSGRQGGTLNRYKANLSSVFQLAKENYGLSINPCREITAKPESAGRVRFLSDNERAALLKACQSSQWDKLYFITLLAITTGARRGELLKLRWRDVEIKNRRATLYDTKNGKNRVLPLTGEVIIELKKFQGIGNALLFPSVSNTEIAYDFRIPWEKALDSAKIDDFHFHDLRHTCASYLAQNGATLVQIAEILGHSNTVVTSRYAHLCINHKQKLVDNVLGNVGL